ncbi:hypothetical protein G6F46_014252 [Rhizopus delemar]|nr:hypothetical protein G6F46_014252 [Rhizopus delemar]
MQQGQRPRHGVVVVLERIGHRFPDGLAAGQLQHRLHGLAPARGVGQHRFHKTGGTDVALAQRNRHAAQALDAAHGLAAAVAAVIPPQRPLARRQHRDQRVRADVARPARHQHMQVRHAGPRQRCAATPGTHACRERGAWAWPR